MEPLNEYQSRIAAWQSREDSFERRHRVTGNLRIFYVLALLAFAAALCRSHVALGWVLLFVMLGLFLSGMVHGRILNARDKARRAVRLHKFGIDRLTDQWAGKGSAGSEYLDPKHPYAADLDIFGKGSLFELLNCAQTQTGRSTLAGWLLHPAAPEEIRSRQAAIGELRANIDLRENLGVQAEEFQAQVNTESLISWAAQPRRLQSTAARILAFCLPVVTVSALVYGIAELNFVPFGISVFVQSAFARIYRERVAQVIKSLGSPVGDLKWLANLLRCVEGQSFQTSRLRELQSGFSHANVPASMAIRRLARLYDMLESQNNLYFAAFCAFTLWGTQFAFAIEAWRAEFGPKIEPWLRQLGEIEAFNSLAGYAFEHPADPFPEFVVGSAGPMIEATGLGHPLIAESRCVRNDVRLGADCRACVISGSNMSGKSTYMRALGVNVVLAMAGAPVRARECRMSPLQIGASIRTLDSLQDGVSRFYAEITRLRDIVNLTGQSPPLLFLLDEILGGTNSHDRRVGAAAVVRSLLRRGAIGLVTTHDLALTKIVEESESPGANFHFEDQLVNGQMSFDYRLRPGIVQKSNALELMRAVGLDIS